MTIDASVAPLLAEELAKRLLCGAVSDKDVQCTSSRPSLNSQPEGDGATQYFMPDEL